MKAVNAGSPVLLCFLLVFFLFLFGMLMMTPKLQNVQELKLKLKSSTRTA